MTMTTRPEQLAMTSKELMLTEAFYGMFLIMLNKRWSDRVSTACVSLNGINYQLDICPKFWDDLTPKHRIGLLKHELKGLLVQ